MFRIVSVACRANAKYCVLAKINNSVTTNNFRFLSAIEQANEKAKEEARKALKAVTSVIGREEPGSTTREPIYDDAYNKKIVDFLDRPDIDSWEIRRLIHDLVDRDAVPDTEIIKAALRACRRLNDFALALRFLEVIKCKCGERLKEFYPYIVQEIRPTLDELGANLPEELGYDKPELAIQDVDDIH